MAVLAGGGYGPMFGQLHTFRRSNRGKALFRRRAVCCGGETTISGFDRQLDDRECVVEADSAD